MAERTWKPVDPGVAFFPVELRPLFMVSGKTAQQQQPALFEESPLVKLQRHFAVVNLENNHPFAVVTDDYELVTNQQAYSRTEEIMHRVFNVMKPEDMVCLNVTMPKTKSFCHIDLIHKSADFSPWEKDKWTAFLRITNSYNRTRLLRYELGFCRWICLNGMIFGSKSIEFSYAHTRRGMDGVDRFVENIGDIRKLELQLTEKLHLLKSYPVPENNMLAILCRAFDFKVTPDVMEKQRRVDDLLELREQTKRLTQVYFSEIEQDGYAALNVLTDFATHPVGVISPETSMHGLQQKAGNWMYDFVSEINKPGFSFDNYLADYMQTAHIINSLQ